MRSVTIRAWQDDGGQWVFNVDATWKLGDISEHFLMWHQPVLGEHARDPWTLLRSVFTTIGAVQRGEQPRATRLTDLARKGLGRP